MTNLRRADVGHPTRARTFPRRLGKPCVKSIRLFRRSANFVDKILRDAKPAHMPIEQPTKFDLIVNLKTAKSLRIELPPTFLARVDDTIE